MECGAPSQGAVLGQLVRMSAERALGITAGLAAGSIALIGWALSSAVEALEA